MANGTKSKGKFCWMVGKESFTGFTIFGTTNKKPQLSANSDNLGLQGYQVALKVKKVNTSFIECEPDDGRLPQRSFARYAESLTLSTGNSTPDAGPSKFE